MRLHSIALFLILTVCVFCIQCKSRNTVKRSFCYWKTSLHIEKAEFDTLDSLGVSHLYVRFFDVEWNPFEKQALPVGTLDKWWDGEIGMRKITPSVFITNTVMEKLSGKQLDMLAINIAKRIEEVKAGLLSRYSEKQAVHRFYSLKQHSALFAGALKDSLENVASNEFKSLFEDVLIDCDWTTNTRDNYFYFLRQFKRLLKSHPLSVTLRLWQFKNRDQAGVPPGDRCLLMCYSMNSPNTYTTSNSIASLNELDKYLTSKRYPKQLDVALPLFSWSVVFRGGNFKGILSEADQGSIGNNTGGFTKIADNRFICRADTVVGNFYMRYGDEIRVEQLSPDDLEKIALKVKNAVSPDGDFRITFFSWDNANINYYGLRNIQKYYSIFTD